MTEFFVSIAPLIIDDILLHDGSRYQDVLGGGGVHCLCGCRVWAEGAGLIASVGSDFNAYRSRLHDLGIDDGGLEYSGSTTTRAWQLYQPGDIRVQVLKHPQTGIRQVLPDFPRLGPRYQLASGYHILWRGTQEDLAATLSEIRTRNPQAAIVLEPTPGPAGESGATYKGVLPFIDAFSPSLDEAQLLSGQALIGDIAAYFLDAGCRVVVLRLGMRGSYGASASGESCSMPAAKASVVDVTGAGNAFLGGLLCGVSSKRSLRDSMGMASVSASFEIETFGPHHFGEDLVCERDERYADVVGRSE